MNILTLQPDVKCGPDRLEAWSEERGVSLDIRLLGEPDMLPDSLDGYDALIVMGGEMGDADTEQYPWLEGVRDRLREAYDTNLPTLGICLGGQLLASALGGEVQPGERGLEVGMVDVRRSESAEEDPLLEGLPPVFVTPSFHNDAVTRLPEGAKLLLTGEKYPHQAFRIGSTWGLQFHPELNPAHFAEWIPLAYATEPSLRPMLEAKHAEFERRDTEVLLANKRLFNNFVDVVSRRAANR